MKIVYAGTRSGTCLSRFHALQQASGADVEYFNTDPYLKSMGRLRHLVETMTFVGPGYARANADLLALCRDRRPDVVWIDKSLWVWPSTLRALRAQGAFLVHHFTDALFPRSFRIRWLFKLMRKVLPLYDLNFPTNVRDHEWMVRQGIPSRLTHNAFDADRFDNSPLPPEVAGKWASDLIFVGHYEPRTERGMLALIDAGLPLKVYGAGWDRARQPERLRPVLHVGSLSDQDYVYALKGAKIGLCFLSELNYNQTTGRSFEIPACGTFLLAMRTPEHLQYYEDGVEAVFFSDHDELVAKARYYLEHDEEREAIARRGHERCTKSDYSWQRYMRDDWSTVLAEMHKKSAAHAA